MKGHIPKANSKYITHLAGTLTKAFFGKDKNDHLPDAAKVCRDHYRGNPR